MCVDVWNVNNHYILTKETVPVWLMLLPAVSSDGQTVTDNSVITQLGRGIMQSVTFTFCAAI